MAPLFGTHTKNTTVIKLRGYSIKLQGSSKVGIQDTNVSDMLDVLGWTPLSQMRQEAQLILFYNIITGLAQVPFEGVLVEAYKGTRRKHNMKFRQIGHTTSQYGQSFFTKTIIVHGTGLLSMKLRHWLYLYQIFFTISMHPIRIIP